MKKVLLSSAALLALAATPAFAQEESGVKLDLGGHFKGYGVWMDQDQNTNEEARNLDIVRETEVHFSGETTLDNGLTVGAHIEADADQGDSFTVDESYAYFSGSWGRVNFGAEDGAAFLLQVAAPSADSNYDGIRQYVQGLNTGVLSTAQTTALTPQYTEGLDYDQDVSGKSDKVTYLTPVFSGFQGGVSYTPEVRSSSRSLDGVDDDESSTSEYGDVWDLGIRYEGQMDGWGLTAGAGYTHAAVETDSSSVDDRTAWNAGVDLDIGAFGLGVAYTVDDQGSDASGDDDVTNWVLGADYTTGPFTLGVSYLNQDDEVGTEVDTDRYTGGVVYSYGPGMTFRGNVSFVDHEIEGSTPDVEATSVMLGTQINF